MAEPKFVLSLPGYDANSATPEQSVIHSETEILKMIDSGSVSASIPTGGTEYTATMPHRGKGFNMIIAQANGIDIPFSTNDYNVKMDIGNKQVVFTINPNTAWSGTVVIRYRVFSTLLK